MTKLRLARPAAADTDTHGEVFLGRAGALRLVALRLVGSVADAEDLLQDAYVQFVVSRPDLAAIEHLDGYLVNLIRNLHVSRQRRRVNQRHLHVSIGDYDTAELALRVTGDVRVVARDALVVVCQHVCARKATSRAASVLALRFFHGFYPAEIAALTKAPERAVRDWLCQARAEARVILEHPGRVRALAPGAETIALPPIDAEDPLAILGVLRRAIFATRTSRCPPPGVLEHWYAGEGTVSMDTSTLSHVVSCADCLGRVAATLSLPDEDERGGGEGSRQPPRSTSGPGAAGRALRGAARRVREVIEHRPRQLLVSANGLVVGGLAVESAWNEVRWTVRLDEPIAFVELHSEQFVRMALLAVSPMPSGTLRQSLRVALSDGRWLVLSVDLTEGHATVSVQYADPTVSAAPTPVALESGASRANARAIDPLPWRRWLSRWGSARRLLRGPMISGAAAVGLIAAMAWLASRVSEPLAAPAVLVERSERREPALGGTEARHRALRFTLTTERGDSEAYRIELWEAGGRRAKATRVFNQAGVLVAGDWTVAGAPTTVRPLRLFDDVWQEGLSAGAFRRYMTPASCSTSIEDHHYTIQCVPDERRSLFEAVVAPLHAQALATVPARAVLYLRTSDLHADRLSLTLPVGHRQRYLTLEEVTHTLMPAKEAPVDVFVPDPSPSAAPAPASPAIAPIDASASLEMRLVEVVDRLAASGVVQVTRTPANRLTVSGYVETADDRSTLVASILRLAPQPTIAISVRTLQDAETLGRPRVPRTRAEAWELPSGPAPFEAYLDQRFPSLANKPGVVRDLAPRVLSAARRALREARALDALDERFTARAMSDLDAEARVARVAMIRRHVDACVQALSSLVEILAPFFPAGEPPPSIGDADIRELVHQLAHATTLINEVAASAFTASEAGEPAAVVHDDFRSHILQALDLCRVVHAAAQATH